MSYTPLANDSQIKEIGETNIVHVKTKNSQGADNTTPGKQTDNDSHLEEEKTINQGGTQSPSKTKTGDENTPMPSELFTVDRAPKWAFKDEPFLEFPKETDQLRILVITWNMYGKKIKSGLDQLLNTESIDHHLIAVGTEECWRSIGASTFCESKKTWVETLQKHLEKKYVMVKAQSMNALHLVLFAQRSLLPYIDNIESAEVATGVANVVGNKGVVGISLRINQSTLLFMNCHLASGSKAIKKRNNDVKRILHKFPLPTNRVAQDKKSSIKTRIQDRFDAVFWTGDFNYRISETKDFALEKIAANECVDLVKSDQLLHQIETHKDLFEGFKEGDIQFVPTYKYEPGSYLFDQNQKKKRTPSWTDRILYSCLQNCISLVSYDSNNLITLSDHRPVFGQFTMRVEANTDNGDKHNFVETKSKKCNIF